MHHAIHTLLSASLAALALAANALAGDTVSLRASARVAHGPSVRLADIATIDGEGAARLGEVVVGRADAGAFELDADSVRAAIARAGLDAAQVKLVGTRSVVRPTRGRAADTARALGTDAVREANRPMPAVAKAAANEITLVDPAEHAGASTPLGIVCTIVANAFHDEPAGALRLAIDAADLAHLAPVAGRRYEIVAKSTLRADRVAFEVVSYEGTKAAGSERIRVAPRVSREVAVANADTRRSSTLDASCVRHETRWLPPSEAERIAPRDSLAGASLARTVTEGSVLETDDLAREIAVRRNERVMLRREIGMIAVELEAIALEDGSAGDIIAFETRGKDRGRDARPITAEIVGRGRAVVR